MEALDLEPFIREGLGGQCVEVPVPAEAPGVDGKKRGRDHPRQYAFGVSGAFLGRKEDGDVGIRVVAALKERQTLHVVPMEMGEQNGASERALVPESRYLADASSGVEEQGRSGAGRLIVGVSRKSETRGMTPVTVEFRAWSRR
jgi:hypothetical protein